MIGFYISSYDKSECLALSISKFPLPPPPPRIVIVLSIAAVGIINRPLTRDTDSQNFFPFRDRAHFSPRTERNLFYFIFLPSLKENKDADRKISWRYDEHPKSILLQGFIPVVSDLNTDWSIPENSRPSLSDKRVLIYKSDSRGYMRKRGPYPSLRIFLLSVCVFFFCLRWNRPFLNAFSPPLTAPYNDAIEF